MTETTNQSRRVARAVAVSASSQAAVKAVHLALNVVAVLALIRYLGPSSFGDYVFVFSFAAVVGLASDLGLSRVAVREMARSEQALPAVLGTSIAIRLALAVLTWFLAQAILLAIGASPGIRLAVAVASLLYVTQALTSVVVLFEVRLAMQYEALVDVVVQAFDTALVLWLVAHHASLLACVAAPVICSGAGVLLAAALARGRFRARVTVEWARVRHLLAESLPVGLSLLVSVVYLKLDSVLLGLLRPSWEVGVYGAAYKPIEYLLMASAVPVNTLFPLLARWLEADRKRFGVVYRRGTDALLAYALPIPILLAFTAPQLVAAVYAPSFDRAALPLQLLSVSLVFMVFNAWQGFVLLAGGHQRVTLLYNAAGLAVNALLNIALILAFGYVGAAVAAIGSSVFVAAFSLAAPARLMHVTPDLGRLARISLANGLLAATLALLAWAGVTWWLELAVAAVAYPLWLLACRVTTPAELRVFLPEKAADEPLPAVAV